MFFCCCLLCVVADADVVAVFLEVIGVSVCAVSVAHLLSCFLVACFRRAGCVSAACCLLGFGEERSEKERGMK